MPFLVAAAPYIAMATSALGAIGEAQSAQAQANATAASEDRNAKIADKNAEITNAQYGQREDQLRREGRQQLGAMRAAIGQSGAGLLGSSRDVYGQSARNLEMDALNLRYAGQLEAVGLMNDAAALRYNAASDRTTGKAAARAGYIRAGTSLLSGPGGNGWGASSRSGSKSSSGGGLTYGMGSLGRSPP